MLEENTIYYYCSVVYPGLTRKYKRGSNSSVDSPIWTFLRLVVVSVYCWDTMFRSGFRAAYIPKYSRTIRTVSRTKYSQIITKKKETSSLCYWSSLSVNGFALNVLSLTFRMPGRTTKLNIINYINNAKQCF